MNKLMITGRFFEWGELAASMKNTPTRTGGWHNARPLWYN